MFKPYFFFSLALLLTANANAQNAWLSDASAEIAASQYYFIQENNKYVAVNEKNQLGFIIDPAGYSVKQVITPEVPKSFGLKFLIQSVQDETIPASAYPQLLNPSKLVFNYPDYRVEYHNDPSGLRQNFIINYKKDNNSLNVKIKIESSLSYVINNNELVFTDGEGKTALKYDGLKVWDANGKLLPASMKINGEILSLEVNDTNAAYPVTIDPLNHAHEWLTSSDGILPSLLTNLALQVDALYGFSMTGLGDINNDGYDDVAVGAPGAINIVASTSFVQAGAVFVFYGSAGGLATSPSKILRSTTPVAGALFGFSVASGDIVGNSRPDIIVGAPLERFSVTVPALIGTDDVNVTSGKVYIFRAEDMSAGAPSPFLSVNLSGSAYFSKGILGLLSNISNKNLFGFSIAVADDLNGDSKGDLVVGVPGYLGVAALSVRSGAAFVYYSNNLSTTTPVQLATPNSSLLGIVSLPLLNTEGLLFGYSVDGAGDFNGDGRPDVVIGAPAGINLNSLGGIFGGKTLSGSAYVFYGNGSGIIATTTTRLEPSTTNLLSTGPNLFGYAVRGTRNASNVRNGKILVGAPLGNILSNVVGALTLKTGSVHLYKTPGSGVIEPDQTIVSPRGSSLLSILNGRVISVSAMFGASIDNTMDINCDGIADIIVGEPLSTGVGLIGVDAVGGAAVVLTGNVDGTYNTSAFQTFTTVTSMDLGINAASMLGSSVAGAGRVFGTGTGPRVMVGAPAKALDFGSGLLDLGSTLGTLFSFTSGNNGLGKAYSFAVGSCSVLSQRERERLTRTLELQSSINNMQVMPNPVTASEFNVLLEKFEPGAYRMEMYSSSGQRVAFSRININGNKQIMPLSRKNFSSGVYSVNIYDSQNKLVSVKRVVFN